MTAQVKNGLKTVQAEVGSVEISLSGPEARALLLILRRVGGDPDTTARRYADNLLNALEGSGINVFSNSASFEKTSMAGVQASLYFTDDSRAAVEAPSNE